MPIRERAGRWYYRFSVNGHEYERSTGLVATERNRNAAQRIEAKARELVLSGRANELRLEVVPFSEAAEKFLMWADSEYREHPNSAKRLRTSFASLIDFFGRAPVTSITKGRIRDYMAMRRTAHEVREVTLRHDLHALSTAYQYWMDHNWAATNAVAGIEMPSDADAVRMHVLSAAEEALYFATAEMLSAPRVVQRKANRRQRAHAETITTDYSDLVDVARIMLEQGCRPDEVMSLRVGDVDLEHGYLYVRAGKSRAAKRRLRLTPASQNVLSKRVGDKPASWVFPSPRKPGAHIATLQRAHESVLEESGLSFVLYDLRHTFATRAAERGTPPAILAAILGHGDLRSISKYVHVRGDAMDAAMDALSVTPVVEVEVAERKERVN